MKLSSATNAWLPLHKHEAKAELRLLCFPHAGAGASAYRTWSPALGPSIEVLAVEYPGRWSRRKERSFTNLKLLVEAMADDLTSVFTERFALLGYSLGSVIAFELARTLRRRGLREPEQLLVCARRAPQLPKLPDPIHTLPDAEFLTQLDRRYGGVPDVLRSDPDLLRTLLAVLRSDLAALETYTYEPEPALTCPITAIGGTDDLQVSEEGLTAWKEQTTAAFSSYRFRGDHFFINTASASVFQLVRKNLLDRPPLLQERRDAAP